MNAQIKFKITGKFLYSSSLLINSEMKCMGCANAVHNALNELGANQISFKDQTGILYNNGTKAYTIQVSNSYDSV